MFKNIKLIESEKENWFFTATITINSECTAIIDDLKDTYGEKYCNDNFILWYSYGCEGEYILLVQYREDIDDVYSTHEVEEMGCIYKIDEDGNICISNCKYTDTVKTIQNIINESKKK